MQPNESVYSLAGSIRRTLHPNTLLLLLFCAVLGALPANAATRTWTGGHASSANWNLRDNWSGATVPANGDTLVFPSGAPRLANTNNIPGLRLAMIQFTGPVGGYVLRGLGVTLTNGITMIEASPNTVRLDSITLGGAQAFHIALGGGLTLWSDIDLNGFNLSLAAIGDLTMRGAISGNGNVSKSGAGQLSLSGVEDNTFTGSLTITSGTLAMSKYETISLVPLTQVSRIAVPGNLTLGNGSGTVVATVHFDDQISNTGRVTVAASATLNLNGHDDAVGDVILSGGEIATGAGTLYLNGDVTALASSTGSLISGQMALTHNTIFAVSNGTAFVDLDVTADILALTGIIKEGAGTLRLGGTNGYFGTTTVNAGKLHVGNDAALGSPNSGTVVNSGAQMFLEMGVDTLREPLTIAGTGFAGAGGALRMGSSMTIATNIVLSAPATIETIGGELVINGVISGTGPLTKVGAGTLVLAGNSGNTFSGELRAEDGVLLLSKLSGSAVQGDLFIGTTNSTATARQTRSANLGGAVTLHADSVYDLDGNNESIDNLTFIGGGTVATGSGLLTVDSDITALGAWTAFSDNAVITGRLRLGSTDNARITSDKEANRPYGVAFFIHAQISGAAAIIKDGPEMLTLTGSNIFTGSLTVEEGELAITDDHALGSTAGDTLVTGDATLRLVNYVHVEDERLFLNSTATNPPFNSTPKGALVCLNSNSWSGPVFLTKTASIGVYTNSTLNITGPINGFAGLTKAGPGTLLYSGTRSNAYIGTTRVDGGTLRLGRTSAHNLAIQGPLIIGDGTGNDVVETIGDRPQIRTLSPVTVNSSGWLILNGTGLAEGIGSLAGTGEVDVNNQVLQTGFDNTSTTFEGIISGSGGLYKHGTGTMTLAGFNEYSGDTLVQEGTLMINGDQPQSDIYVYPAATLTGNGWVGDLSIGGTLNPGNPLGPLRAESVNFLPGSTMIERIEARPQAGAFTPYGNNWFQCYSGPVDVTGAALDISLGFPPSAGQEFKIGTALGVLPPTGTFAGKPEGALIMLNQIPFHLSYQGGSGNDIVLTVGELVLRLDSTRVEAGNGNGRIEPDECNDLFVVIENPTAAGVNVLNAYLQSLDNRIVVTQAESEYGSVPASTSRTNRTAFQIRSAPNYPCGQNAEFHLVLETVGHGRFAIPITLPTGTPGSFQEFASPAAPTIIPDAGALSSQIPVGLLFKVGKVRVSLHATHPSAGQLRLKLISPQGVEVLLAEGEGGAGNNYGQSCERRTTFVDSAFISIATAEAPFSGTFAPEGNLSDLAGLDSLGVWTLLVEDTVAGGLGALQCWTLELAPAECAPAGGGCDSCFATVNGALDAGRAMPERLLSGYPTGCGDAPHCPTISSVWHDPYRYTTHTFTNTGPDACVTVMLTVPCAEPNRGLTGSAYLGDFDPANLCANLLGVSGDKVEQGSGGFSFHVPAGERFTVVVNERNTYEDFQGCDIYSLQLYGLPCPEEQPRLHIANDAGPDKVRLHWSTAYPGFELQGKTSLGGPGIVSKAYTNVTTAPTVHGGHYSVTNSASGPSGFFRLRKQ